MFSAERTGWSGTVLRSGGRPASLETVVDDVLAKLKKAIAEGAALATLGLAGCSAPVIPGTDGGATEWPHPLAGACHGPVYDSGFGYHGQCCNRTDCVSCDGGSPRLPPGSGSCGCAVSDTDSRNVIGPFAASDGTCCYVFGSITCDGRPLLVDGELVTAPVVSRSDWA